MKRKITWSTIDQLIDKIVEQIIPNSFSGVYGVGRGGQVPAVILSHRLGIPLLTEVKESCLIVDDIADSGKTLREIDPVRDEGIAVLFRRHSCKNVITHFIGEIIDNDDWIVFPWENEDSPEEEVGDDRLSEIEPITAEDVEKFRDKVINESLGDKVFCWSREYYGEDVSNEPNDHCYWCEFEMCWRETDEHFRERIMREY